MNRLLRALALFVFASTWVTVLYAEETQAGVEVPKITKITGGPKRVGGPGLGFGGGGVPGGWSGADVKSKEVLAIANFAAGKLFPNLHPAPKVTSAMTQVVAGINYNLTLEITHLVRVGSSSTSCTVVSCNVWDRFGTLNLMRNQTVGTRCNA
jgi:hypothetical protein